MTEGGITLTEKDLKKLNRYQLLELLIAQTERADKLEARLEVIKKQFYDQEIRTSNLGSIAEASLQLKGVFSAAQEAADMYLNEARRQADAIIEDARKKADEIVAEAEEEAKKPKDET